MKNLVTTFAANSDLNDAQFERLLAEARDFENRFLKKEHLIRDADYRWPRTAVENWGRIWEYPYVRLMIEKICKTERIESIADVGSGITFFPLWLSSSFESIRKIYTVDNDKVCVEGNRNIREVFSVEGGEKLEPVLSDGLNLGDIPDGSVDLIYSVSVIEHIEGPEELIESISKKLRDGGIFIATIDVALRDDFGINVDEYNSLMSVILRHFKFEGEVRNIHPMDMLTSVNSPVKSELRSVIGRAKGIMKDLILGNLRNRHSDYKLEIACYGMVMRKK